MPIPAIRFLLGVMLAITTGRPLLAAEVDVFACEPEWASLATELGGNHVDARSATTALQDPHRIEARPSLIARVRNADLVVCTGAELEIAWLPLLMQSAANRDVQPGSPGFVAAAELVTRLDVPAVVDRAAGDIHPAGNPHVHLDPQHIASIALAITARLAAIDPVHRDIYVERGADFQTRWAAAIARWQARAAPLAGARFITQHGEHRYLFRWLGIEIADTIEPKPGVPPTAAHLAALVERATGTPVAAIALAAYQDPKGARWLAERTELPVLELPFTVGGSPAAADLFSLYDATIDVLLTAPAAAAGR